MSDVHPPDIDETRTASIMNRIVAASLQQLIPGQQIVADGGLFLQFMQSQ